MLKNKIGLKISVIIPALNEEKFIAATIQSIQDQDFKDFEIIVVDNGSKDHTAIIAKKMGVKVVFEPIRGLPQARETGRLSAHGEILVYLDADMLIPKNYLSRIYKTFLKNKRAVAVSNTFYYHDSSWQLNIFIKIFFNLIIPIYRRLLNLFKLPMLIFGGNFAVRAAALTQINGFDTRIKFYGEDADLAKRISKIGKVLFLRTLVAKTSARRFIREGFIRTNLNYLVNYFSIIWQNHPVSERRIKFWLGLVKIIFFILLIVFVYAMINPKSELLGKVVYQLNTPEKAVALTFDDGPNGKYTEQVLAILDQENIKATFFLIGKNVEAYPNLARLLIAKGHIIGNHTYDHPWRLPFERRKYIWKEILSAEDAIFKATGQHPKLFRPPHGLRTNWMLKEIRHDGYIVVTWDDMTDDYVYQVAPKKIIKNILNHVRPGSIIVLHDGLNLDHLTSRGNTIQALPIIIKQLKNAGYKFVTLNEKKLK